MSVASWIGANKSCRSLPLWLSDWSGGIRAECPYRHVNQWVVSCYTGNEASLRKCLKIQMKSKDKAQLRVKTCGLFSGVQNQFNFAVCVHTHACVSACLSVSLCPTHTHSQRERRGSRLLLLLGHCRIDYRIPLEMPRLWTPCHPTNGKSFLRSIVVIHVTCTKITIGDP